MPIDQLRNMLFIGLLLTAFLIWQAWQEDYGPRVPPSTQDAAREAPGVPAPPAATTVPSAPSGTSPAQGSADVPAPPGGVRIEGQAALPSPAQGRRLQVTTDLLDVTINLDGGTIEELLLLEYPTSVDQPEIPFKLMTAAPDQLFTAQFGLLGSADAPNHRARFDAPGDRFVLAPADDELPVVLSWSAGNNLVVEKRYVFKRNSYAVLVEHRVKNTGNEPWTGRMYGQFQRKEVASEGGLFRTYTYTGGVLSDSEKPYEKITFDDMANSNLQHQARGGWVGMIQHYFAAALLPGSDDNNYYFSNNKLGNSRYALGVMTPESIVAPGGESRFAMTVYAGPKDRDRLKALAPNLERTVDYGWLWFIAEPLFIALRWIHGVVGNWGFAIILLTIVIKGLFFHLSAASYKSMARMRKLQPRIVQLRERYASDKTRMNTAMMELYKEEKINPLGGCLPILVQIPVFIALYWVLLESVELRQAPFMLWIRDMSERDPYFVLPLLMGASMFVQQRLNPAPPDPIQAKVMMALPIVFTFLFLGFPAGLVLYWIVNNLLSIAQQWVITRKIVGPDG